MSSSPRTEAGGLEVKEAPLAEALSPNSASDNVATEHHPSACCLLMYLSIKNPLGSSTDQMAVPVNKDVRRLEGQGRLVGRQVGRAGWQAGGSVGRQDR
ncbi:hypothetical protein PPACK8108_LOCUS4780 [Phakopsora pachyrhizi]|uniref:Uncharacterized protein n=1 Tax=Phakopsora pachyrhizi TaxID=170000 RepID=A0AAV0AMM5_PHAPC|nr:hypothetical protein PPACK8108_LOCUS4780 [Phakopsora pachyrhizi]